MAAAVQLCGPSVVDVELVLPGPANGVKWGGGRGGSARVRSVPCRPVAGSTSGWRPRSAVERAALGAHTSQLQSPHLSRSSSPVLASTPGT